MKKIKDDFYAACKFRKGGENIVVKLRHKQLIVSTFPGLFLN